MGCALGNQDTRLASGERAAGPRLDSYWSPGRGPAPVGPDPPAP